MIVSKVIFVFFIFLISNYNYVYSINLSEYACSTNKYKWACGNEQSTHRLTRAETKEEKEEKEEKSGDSDDDPACRKLKKDYDVVCFTPPPAEAFIETKAFCEAFIQSCSHILKTNLFTNLESIEVDYRAYCAKHSERFGYVCPDPLRFHAHKDDAVEFCARYKYRCPAVELPNEPLKFKDPDEGHIYIREWASPCGKMKRFARNYCTDLDLLKVPKYQIPCATYKYFCLDLQTRVIYGG